MMRKFGRPALLGGLAGSLLVVAGTSAAAAAPSSAPTVRYVEQIDHQDVESQGNCEPNTLVEPDISVSPFNSSIAVAVAHDCRFANGGAVDISYAWTHDGGATWHNAPVPDLTKKVGGVWDRASDPVVDYGTDGTVYILALVFDATTCPTGVTISRSSDGGATFGPPIVVHQSTTCAYSDDKDWLTVDRQPKSPHYGRLYVFWTPFISSASGKLLGDPQAVRWSDNGGTSWSDTHYVTGKNQSTQDSQPMVQPNGDITDVYMHDPTLTSLRVDLYASTSSDGGATWSDPSVLQRNIGVGPNGIRCCLPAASIDPVTGEMYAIWQSGSAGETVEVQRSSDGVTWSDPVDVTHTAGRANIQHVNTAIGAYGGKVFVSYGTRNTAVDSGRYVQQQLAWSFDDGSSYSGPLTLGPPSDLRYAAVAGGKFPGDYMAISVRSDVVETAWCVSSPPSNPNAKYHQTLYAAVLTP